MFLHLLLTRQAAFPSIFSYALFSCLLRIHFSCPTRGETEECCSWLGESLWRKKLRRGVGREGYREIGIHETDLQKIPDHICLSLRML